MRRVLYCSQATQAGATITSAFRSASGTWSLTFALLLGAFGILLRTFASQRCTEIAAEYER